MGRLHRLDAGAFLAHERPRRPDDAVNDGNVAGKQIGKLCEKQRRAQLAEQALIQARFRIVVRPQFFGNRSIDFYVALAAGGGDDHVHPLEKLLVAGHASIRQRETGGVGADALP